MNTNSLVMLSLLVVSSVASADQKFPSVNVHADQQNTLTIACHASAPNPTEVARILNINDSSQTSALRSKLLTAVNDACDAGISMITVTRGANGKSLSWAPANDAAASVAWN